ncbi:uncharacterized protein [Palaemon carinicauda]|uniref:uncharacterized protein n=1 Tax=Palaemon carinicauda TaxID=392227 RepID=UPI0035B6A12F
METPREKKILRIAKARDAASKDLTQIRQIKDSNGIVLAKENEIKRSWKTYFEGLLNENSKTVFEDGLPNDGLPNEAVTIGVTKREVVQAVKKMKNSKAAGLDNIPVEVWKSLGEKGIDVLWDLMQKIFNQEKMPQEWRGSLIIHIYKGKGDIQGCGNYRGIKVDLMQKIFNQEKMPQEWRGSLNIHIYKGKGDIRECGNYRGIKLDLMQKIFNQEKMPQEWRGSLIIHIYKGKGDIQECGNYRGIKLISHTMGEDH